jgi:hypothetical protein
MGLLNLQDHEEEVKQKCKVQNFENVNGIDFNVWAIHKKIE